jgi:hypothetical protein
MLSSTSSRIMGRLGTESGVSLYVSLSGLVAHTIPALGRKFAKPKSRKADTLTHRNTVGCKSYPVAIGKHVGKWVLFIRIACSVIDSSDSFLYTVCLHVPVCRMLEVISAQSVAKHPIACMCVCLVCSQPVTFGLMHT